MLPPRPAVEPPSSAPTVSVPDAVLNVATVQPVAAAEEPAEVTDSQSALPAPTVPIHSVNPGTLQDET